jgi:Family of unknown function (DUF6166)
MTPFTSVLQGITYADGRRLVLYDGRPLDPRRDLVDYGCREFEWGYDGPAPCQLALAILAAVLGDDAAALHWHREYVRPGIVPLVTLTWHLQAAEVMAWFQADPHRAGWLCRN